MTYLSFHYSNSAFLSQVNRIIIVIKKEIYHKNFCKLLSILNKYSLCPHCLDAPTLRCIFLLILVIIVRFRRVRGRLIIVVNITFSGNVPTESDPRCSRRTLVILSLRVFRFRERGQDHFVLRGLLLLTRTFRISSRTTTELGILIPNHSHGPVPPFVPLCLVDITRSRRLLK